MKNNNNFSSLFTDVIIDELEHLPNSPYIPRSAIEESLRQHIFEYVDELQEDIAKGYSLSLELLKAKGVSLSPYTLTQSQLKKLHNEEMMKALANKEVVLAEAFGMGAEELYHLYEGGFDLFNQEHYVEARAVFTYLLVLHPRVADFWTALGSCFEKMHKDAEAAVVFSLSAALKPHLIESYLPLAHLLIERGHLYEAGQLFMRVIEISEQLEEGQERDILAQEAKKYLDAL